MTVTVTVSLQEKYVCPAPRDEQIINTGAERAPVSLTRIDPNCCTPQF